MTVTIFDVAERAGVSISTVSRVLNNRDRVHASTRERVLKAVRELNYQRNALAQSLATQKTNMMGLVIPMVNDPFFFEIVRGVEDAATAKGYSLLIASQPHPAQEHRYLNLFRRGYVDAMVLTAADIQEHEVKQVIEQGVPVVLVQQYHKSISSFGVDNYGGACTMARHLLGLGYRRIAYITGTDYTIDNAERLRGLRDCLAEHGLDLPDTHIASGDYRHGSGYDAMKSLLHLPQRPEAVFAANDQMALDAIRAAKDYGLHVPDDIAVVGYDDISLAHYVDPPLTTVAQPAYELGYQAASLALEIIDTRHNGREPEPKHVNLPTKLVVRRSCGANRK
jgi:DNA-binding LacI/PurR family transcriptional regulator